MKLTECCILEPLRHFILQLLKHSCQNDRCRAHSGTRRTSGESESGIYYPGTMTIQTFVIVPLIKTEIFYRIIQNLSLKVELQETSVRFILWGTLISRHFHFNPSIGRSLYLRDGPTEPRSRNCCNNHCISID